MNICPKHNKELRNGKSGRLFCPTPITRDSKGKVVEWCDYNPTNAPADTQPVSLPQAPVTPVKPTEMREIVREPIIESKVNPKVWEDKDLRIARESALHSATRNNQGHQVDPALIILEAQEYINFIYNGLKSNEDINDIELPSETLDQLPSSEEN